MAWLFALPAWEDSSRRMNQSLVSECIMRVPACDVPEGCRLERPSPRPNLLSDVSFPLGGTGLPMSLSSPSSKAGFIRESAATPILRWTGLTSQFGRTPFRPCLGVRGQSFETPDVVPQPERTEMRSVSSTSDSGELVFRSHAPFAGNRDECSRQRHIRTVSS